MQALYELDMELGHVQADREEEGLHLTMVQLGQCVVNLEAVKRRV